MLQQWPWCPIFAVWMACLPRVVSICEEVLPAFITWRDRCPFVAFIRRIRLERPSFRVLDIGAVGSPWSIHSGAADVIFDFQATDEEPRAEACCSSLDDQCFDKLFTRERCCRGKQPVFVGMIDGDVTNVESAGWAKLCLARPAPIVQTETEVHAIPLVTIPPIVSPGPPTTVQPLNQSIHLKTVMTWMQLHHTVARTTLITELCVTRNEQRQLHYILPTHIVPGPLQESTFKIGLS
eukprot:s2040_g1.t1